jgi:hypothetical protein
MDCGEHRVTHGGVSRHYEVQRCAGRYTADDGKKNRRSTVYDKMYLKHYITKSFEEYIWKVYVRGMHTKGAHRKMDDFFEINQDMLERYDECMKFKDEYFKKMGVTY